MLMWKIMGTSEALVLYILVADPRVARDKFVFDSVIILYY